MAAFDGDMNELLPPFVSSLPGFGATEELFEWLRRDGVPCVRGLDCGEPPLIHVKTLRAGIWPISPTVFDLRLPDGTLLGQDWALGTGLSSCEISRRPNSKLSHCREVYHLASR